MNNQTFQTHFCKICCFINLSSINQSVPLIVHLTGLALHLTRQQHATMESLYTCSYFFLTRIDCLIDWFNNRYELIGDAYLSHPLSINQSIKLMVNYSWKQSVDLFLWINFLFSLTKSWNWSKDRCTLIFHSINQPVDRSWSINMSNNLW